MSNLFSKGHFDELICLAPSILMMLSAVFLINYIKGFTTVKAIMLDLNAGILYHQFDYFLH
jgi:hypothetical protein